jgi:hypothetical protein
MLLRIVLVIVKRTDVMDQPAKVALYAFGLQLRTMSLHSMPVFLSFLLHPLSFQLQQEIGLP